MPRARPQRHPDYEASRVTVYLGKETLAAAKVLAAQRAISMSGFLADLVDAEIVKGGGSVTSFLRLAEAQMNKLGLTPQRSERVTDPIDYYLTLGNGLRVGVVLEPALNSVSVARLLQALAVTATVNRVEHVILLTPDSSGDRTMHKLLSIASSSTYVPISVAKLERLKEVLEHLNKRKPSESAPHS